MTTGKAEVVLARHGETEWSKSGQHTGRSDIPLTDNGRRQAEAVRPLLAVRTYALVLTSPLQRARETCELAGLGDQAEVCDDLLEWDYGEYEGRKTVDIRAERPGWTVFSGPMPGGESIQQVSQRVDRVIARAGEAGGDVALFAHGHVLRVLAARWCDLDPIEGRRLPLSTGTISVLGWEHETRGIAVWNQPPP